MRPPFVKVVPDEIEQYGFAGATVLAHLRFRCESEGPNRFERDGFRWWRISRRDFGDEIGVSADTVKRTLLKLGDAVVAANNLDNPEDQTRAYRPADAGDAVNCQKADSPQSDLPEGEIAEDRGEIAKVPGRNRHLYYLQRPRRQKTETREKRARKSTNRPSPKSSPFSETIAGRKEQIRRAHVSPTGGDRTKP